MYKGYFESDEWRKLKNIEGRLGMDWQFVFSQEMLRLKGAKEIKYLDAAALIVRDICGLNTYTYSTMYV